jgi:hypothetical protein
VSAAFYYYYRCTSTSNDIAKKINKLPPQVKTRNFSDEFSFDLDEFSLSTNNNDNIDNINSIDDINADSIENDGPDDDFTLD